MKMIPIYEVSTSYQGGNSYSVSCDFAKSVRLVNKESILSIKLLNMTNAAEFDGYSLCQLVWNFNESSTALIRQSLYQHLLEGGTI